MSELRQSRSRLCCIQFKNIMLHLGLSNSCPQTNDWHQSGDCYPLYRVYCLAASDVYTFSHFKLKNLQHVLVLISFSPSRNWRKRCWMARSCRDQRQQLRSISSSSTKTWSTSKTDSQVPFALKWNQFVSLQHSTMPPPSFRFPLFNAVYQICFEGHPVTEFISCLQNHPEHM